MKPPTRCWIPAPKTDLDGVFVAGNDQHSFVETDLHVLFASEKLPKFKSNFPTTHEDDRPVIREMFTNAAQHSTALFHVCCALSNAIGAEKKIAFRRLLIVLSHTLRVTDLAGFLLEVYDLPQPRFLSSWKYAWVGELARYLVFASPQRGIRRDRFLLETLRYMNQFLMVKYTLDIDRIWKQKIDPALKNIQSKMNVVWAEMYQIFERSQLQFALGLVLQYITTYKRDRLLEAMGIYNDGLDQKSSPAKPVTHCGPARYSSSNGDTKDMSIWKKWKNVLAPVASRQEPAISLKTTN